MSKAICSRKRASTIYTATLLVGLALLFIIQNWWPSILIVVGTALGIKQYLVGKKRDSILTFVVFYGFFAISFLDVSWRILVPSIMILTAFYIVAKEWIEDKRIPTEREQDEEIQQQFAEKKHYEDKK